MLYLRSWLEEYIDLGGVSDSELANLISLKSGEVESFRLIEDWFSGKVLVGQIKNLRNHPNADKLKIFEVDLGDQKEAIQIVSAATNARENLLVAVATMGTQLPYFKVSERVLRGETSYGLCLGKSELMLETEFSSGLWELDAEFSSLNRKPVLGQSICEALPEFFPKETIFEIKYLQDKIGSCGSHLGLSLEIAYILGQNDRLKPRASRLLKPEEFWLEFEQKAQEISKSDSQTGTFKDQTNYTRAFFVLDLELSTEAYFLPHTFQKRMFFTGKNLIGGLADLSNYLLWDMAQPSHFFVDKKGSFSFNWSIQKLSEPEVFEGLGKLEKALLPVGTEVIRDAKKIVWIPGISGSKEAKVSTADTKISIEIANFQKEKVARNSFHLNYRSDSARFWNSGLDSNLILVWLLHFWESFGSQKINLKLKLSWLNPEHFNGNPAQNLLEKFQTIFVDSVPKSFKIDKKSLIKRIQNNLSENLLEENLSSLGSLKNDHFYPRTFYNYLENQEDLLFEISKIIGLENLPAQYLEFTTNVNQSKDYQKQSQIKEVLTRFGFQEIITRPLVSEKAVLANILNFKDEAMTALSTQRQDENKLRDSLLPSLLESVNRNLNLGFKEIRLFEIDKIYTFSEKIKEELILEAVSLDADPYNFTSFIENLRVKTGAQLSSLDKTIFELGSGYLYSFSNGIEIKLIELKNTLKKAFQIPLNRKIWFLSLNLSQFEGEISEYDLYSDEVDFPMVRRSFSWVIPSDFLWSKVAFLASKLSFEDVQVLLEPKERFSKDLKKSVLNFEITFKSNKKTITNQEILLWTDKFLASIKAEIGDFESR